MISKYIKTFLTNCLIIFLCVISLLFYLYILAESYEENNQNLNNDFESLNQDLNQEKKSNENKELFEEKGSGLKEGFNFDVEEYQVSNVESNESKFDIDKENDLGLNRLFDNTFNINKETLDKNAESFDKNRSLELNLNNDQVNDEVNDQLKNFLDSLLILEKTIDPSHLNILKEISANQNDQEVSKTRNIFNLTVDTKLIKEVIDKFDQADSVTSSELFEREVRNIRESPVSSNNSSDLRKLISELKYDESIVILTPKSNDVTNIPKVDETKGSSEDTGDVRNTDKIRQYIFSKIKPHQPDHPLPLPSWFIVPEKPTDPAEVDTWNKDNEARKYWTSKFPFLSEHFEQINITRNRFRLEKESNNSNVFDIDKEEVLGIENMFNAEQSQVSNVESNENRFDIDKEEDLGLNRLFDDDNVNSTNNNNYKNNK